LLFAHSGQQIVKLKLVARVKERLSVNKQRSHRFCMERFSLKKLNEVEDKEKYRVEI
jgi:hypothetical protein